jgi:hypothetical protein
MGLFGKLQPPVASRAIEAVLAPLYRRRLIDAAQPPDAIVRGYTEAQLPVHLAVTVARQLDSMVICQLDDVCLEIAKHYPPGVRITVCTEGSEQLAELNTLIRHIDASGVDVIDISEFDAEGSDLRERAARCFPKALQLAL